MNNIDLKPAQKRLAELLPKQTETGDKAASTKEPSGRQRRLTFLTYCHADIQDTDSRVRRMARNGRTAGKETMRVDLF